MLSGEAQGAGRAGWIPGSASSCLGGWDAGGTCGQNTFQGFPWCARSGRPGEDPRHTRCVILGTSGAPGRPEAEDLSAGMKREQDLTGSPSPDPGDTPAGNRS